MTERQSKRKKIDRRSVCLLAVSPENPIMKILEMEILKTRRVMTVINGEAVWEAGR